MIAPGQALRIRRGDCAATPSLALAFPGHRVVTTGFVIAERPGAPSPERERGPHEKYR